MSQTANMLDHFASIPTDAPRGDTDTSVPLSQQRLSGSVSWGGALGDIRRLAMTLTPLPHNTPTQTHTHTHTSQMLAHSYP